MRAVTKEKTDQAKQEIRERKDKRNVYVKSWRQSQRIRRRVSSFVEEYVREKFNNIYSEALNFYNALDMLYPKKYDLRRTLEFRRWKQAICDGNNSEILTPVTPLNEAALIQIQSNRSTHQPDQQQQGDNLVLRIPLIPHSSIPQTRTVEIPQPSTPPEIPSSQPSTPPEIPTHQPSTVPEIGAEFTVEMPPLQPESLAGLNGENIDQRIQEIIEELQNDPDLNGIFDNLQTTEQTDEGIGLSTFEEEMEVDIGLIDQDPDFYGW